ncbi:MAG: substrate-binding domain-containing protein [Bacillota bacterium]|nr:substrate-binding domain-containing protein [Bacillota bacterium]
MKKTILGCLMLVIFVSTMFTGCGSSSQASPTEQTTSDSTSATSLATDSATDPTIADAATSIVATTVSTSSVSTASASSNSGTSNSVSKTSTSTKSGSSVSTSTTQRVSDVKSSVATGAYLSAISLSLSTSTSGATIYYTTNGSNPTTSSTKYTGAIHVSSTTTVKAIAVKSGMTTSAVSSFSYTFGKLSGNITADGSTALQPLLNLAAPMFKGKYSAVFSGSVTVNGGGSGQGLTDVESGAVMVGDSDVTVAQAGKGFSNLVDHQICVVAVAMVVSSDVANHFGSNSISMSDIKKIYEGKITNWKDVSGSGSYNKPIMVCYRKKGSGTRTLFETFGTGEKFDENASYVTNNDAFIFTSSSADLQSQVDNNQGCIGYETLPYAQNMRKLSVNFGSGAVACNYSNVDNGSYKIWGFEHLYTKGTPNATVKAFINYVTSEDFKSTIVANGYGLSSDVAPSVAASHQ